MIAHDDALTVTVKVQLSELVQVTVVVPSGNVEPDGGVQVTGVPEHGVGSV